MSPITQYKVRPWQIHCDTCGDAMGSDELGGTPLYDDRAEAFREAGEMGCRVEGEVITCTSCLDEEKYAAEEQTT